MMEPSDFLAWCAASRHITVVDEGLQLQLFSPEPIRIYRLFNEQGDTITVSAEMAQSYGLRPSPGIKVRNLTDSQTDLFAPPQERLF